MLGSKSIFKVLSGKNKAEKKSRVERLHEIIGYYVSSKGKNMGYQLKELKDLLDKVTVNDLLSESGKVDFPVLHEACKQNPATFEFIKLVYSNEKFKTLWNNTSYVDIDGNTPAERLSRGLPDCRQFDNETLDILDKFYHIKWYKDNMNIDPHNYLLNP